MNQSMGANSLLEKYAEEDLKRELSSDELWKTSFASSQSQTNVQNTNQVYENLLRICEDIDAALPEIQSSVNNGGLHVNEHRCLDENKMLQNSYLRGTEFDDIGPCLDDIQIYEDLFNTSAYMLSNNYDDPFSYATCDHLHSNENKDTHASHYQIKSASTSVPTRGDEIFADSEIEQYMKRSQRFSAPVLSTRQDEVEDPLQLWRKLNHNAELQSPTIAEKPVPDRDHESIDETKKPAKSVLAIFDFTMPSLSSSASSSPAQKDLDMETISSKIANNLIAQTSIERVTGRLPNLTPSSSHPNNIPNIGAKKKKDRFSKKRKPKSMELLDRELVLSSSSSRGSSTSPPQSSKHRKKESRKKSTLPSSRKPINETTKKKHSSTNTHNSSLNRQVTSPTLRAGAAYIEKQLNDCTPKIQQNVLDSTKNSISMPDLDKLPPLINPSSCVSCSTKIKTCSSSKEKHRESRKDKSDHKKYNTRSNSKPRIGRPEGSGASQKSNRLNDASSLIPVPRSLPQLEGDLMPLEYTLSSYSDNKEYKQFKRGRPKKTFNYRDM